MRSSPIPDLASPHVSVTVPQWLAGVACSLAVARFVFVLRGVFLTRFTDFQAFYLSTIAWQTHTIVPIAASSPNLNPPTFFVVLWPFTAWPLPTALALWTIVGASCVVLSLVWIARTTTLTVTEWLIVIAIVCGSAPAVQQWREGQVGALLLLFVTIAWSTRARPLLSALVLGLAVALKPPLALMVLVLPFRLAWRAAVIAGIVTIWTIILTGWGPWATWLQMSGRVTAIGAPENGSLWGFCSRMTGGVGAFRELSPVAGACILLIGAVLATDTIRQSNEARRWSLALLLAIAIQPLGWAYWWLIGLAPFVVAWPRTRMGIAALLAIGVGFSSVAPPSLPLVWVLLSSMQTIGLGLLWWTWRG